ncbi:MAG: glycine cleavage system protein GcvH [Sphingomonadaceae bacterium]|nr:glycine cleavage system protein GcvH [Sphingomonadaceae bacterium]
MRRFTKTHEWIELDGAIATVGITPHAVEQLGDLVFFEATASGKAVSAGDPAATVESVKAASEVYAPVAGTVTDGNQAVVDDPSLANSDPTGAGWLFRMSGVSEAEVAELMDEDGYNAMLLAA